MPGSREEEQKRVADELERVRDAARATPVPARSAEEVLPPRRPMAGAPLIEPVPSPASPKASARPDNAAVNQLWALPLAPPPRGISGRLFGFLRRVLAPLWDAQTSFNSRQVQLDN